MYDAQGHVKVYVGQRLGQPGEVLDVLVGCTPPLARIGVDGKGCVGPGAKIDLVLIQLHAILAVGADYYHLSGERSPRLVHHPGGHLHQAAVFGGVLDNRAPGVGDLDSLFIVHTNASLVQYSQGCVVDGFDLFLAEHLELRRGVHFIIRFTHLHGLSPIECR